MSEAFTNAGAHRPPASIVILSTRGSHAVLEILDALPGRGSSDVEILVVARQPLPPDLRPRFPAVRTLELPGNTSLPTLRARGLREARGDVVAILGEHLRPGPGWLAAVLRVDGGSAAGGPVVAGTLRGAAAWAFFLLEYAAFIPPASEPPRLAGSNCVYGRRALDQLPPLPEVAFDEELHASLRRAGAPFVHEPGLLMRCEKSISVRHFLAQRFHCGRVSAAARARPWPGWKRMAFAALTPLLPLVLLGRLFITLARKRRHGGAVVRAFPLIAVALVCGAWGEAVGCLAGPGRSGERAE